LSGPEADIGQIAGFVQSTLVLVACHKGLGKSETVWPLAALEGARGVYRASNTLYVITLALVKCSAACSIANLTVKNAGSMRDVPKMQKWSVYVIIGHTMAWILMSILFLVLPCSYAQPGSKICIGTVRTLFEYHIPVAKLANTAQYNRWIGIFAGDAVTDLYVTVLAASVVWRTHAAVQTRILWFMPFCLRLWYVFGDHISQMLCC
jgi:hypothetical protein